MRLPWLAPLILLILGIFLRAYSLNSLPNGYHWDEYDTNYQAYSLISTGKDYFGNILPLFPHSLAEYRTPVLIYMTLPFIDNPRLVSVIFGSLFLVVIFILSRNIFTLLVATISPWLVQYSRQAVESQTMITILLVGLACWQRKHLLLGSVFFGLAMFTYSPAKFFVPLLFGFLLFKQQLQLKIIAPALIFSLFAAVAVLDSLFGVSGTRFRQLSILNDPTTGGYVNFERQEQAVASGVPKEPGMQPRFIDKLVYNKPSVFWDKFSRNYLSAFSTEFLFTKGDRELRHSPSENKFGMLLVSDFIPLFIGIILLKSRSLPMFWFLVGPLGASLTVADNPHAARLSLWVPVLILITGVGIKKIWNYSHGLLVAYLSLTLFSAIGFYSYFFANYRHESAAPFQYGFQQAIAWAKSQSKPVIVDAGPHSGLMAFLSTTKYPPKEFQIKVKNLQEELLPGIHVARFNNISLTIPGNRPWNDFKIPVGTSLAVYSTQPQAASLSNKVGQINYPSGLPAFYLYSY